MLLPTLPFLATYLSSSFTAKRAAALRECRGAFAAGGMPICRCPPPLELWSGSAIPRNGAIEHATLRGQEAMLD